MRVTNSQLEAKAATINTMLGFEGKKLWNRIENQNVATIGMVYVSGQYRGVSLYQMANEAGGVHDLTGTVTKRELAEYMRGMINGLANR